MSAATVASRAIATGEGVLALARGEIDAVTVDSHQRAGRAWTEGRYASAVVPITRADGNRVKRHQMV